jgi:hypothetical protein
MKIEIDNRPKKEGSPSFYGIRLYPETNEEMAELEFPIELNLNKLRYKRIVCSGKVNYLIDFDI